MRFFFVLALGRSGTVFLSSLLSQDARALVHHEPDPMDPKLLGLRHSGAFDAVVDGLLEQRFERLLGQAEARGVEIYGEVNSYLRYESEWLRRRFEPVLIHLVRDGRAFVRSAHTRTIYTPWEEQQPVVPSDGDPYAARWPGMSRFEKLCWCWQHTNEMLARHHDVPVQLERVLEDYDHLRERILEPAGLSISRDLWRRTVERPRNTSAQSRRRRMLRRLILRRPRDREMPPISHWREWSAEQTRQFWEICGPTMEKMGYEGMPR